jgi:hypothetical protein
VSFPREANRRISGLTSRLETNFLLNSGPGSAHDFDTMKRLLFCALIFTGCSKVNVYTTAQKPEPSSTQVQAPAAPLQPQSESASPQVFQNYAPAKTGIERVAEIDTQLAAPLTGNPDDADRRAQLRAERDALTGASRPVSQPSYASAPQPSYESHRTGIVVAPDSQAGPNRLGWEALTPSEKKDYYKLIRLSRPNVLIQDNRF